MRYRMPKYHTIYHKKNGVVERMNKTLMEKARSILNGVGLTKELWEEVSKNVRYLVNRYPSSMLVDSNPHGLVRCLCFHILDSLDVMHLCMLPRKRGTHWRVKQSIVFSSDTRME
jgi:hypothetical protein